MDVDKLLLKAEIALEQPNYIIDTDAAVFREIIADWKRLRELSNDCGKCVNPLDFSGYVLKFGKHKGKRLDAVPLEYLDWCAGLDDCIGRYEIATYLRQPEIAAELKKALDT